jgi:hypothetical protein
MQRFKTVHKQTLHHEKRKIHFAIRIISAFSEHDSILLVTVPEKSIFHFKNFRIRHVSSTFELLDLLMREVGVPSIFMSSLSQIKTLLFLSFEFTAFLDFVYRSVL